MSPRQKAQRAVTELKEAALELLEEFPSGLRNVDVADQLDIRSSHLGRQQDYLSWSVLGLLLNEERLFVMGTVMYTASMPNNRAPSVLS